MGMSIVHSGVKIVADRPHYYKRLIVVGNGSIFRCKYCGVVANDIEDTATNKKRMCLR